MGAPHVIKIIVDLTALSIRKYSLFCLLGLFLGLSSPVGAQEGDLNLTALAQDMETWPADKRELAQQLLGGWSEESFKTVERFLLSDSNYRVSEFIKALNEGRSPEDLAALADLMDFNEGTHEKMLLHLVQRLRAQPERLAKMVESAESLRHYLQKRKIKFTLGLRVYNSALLSLDFTAILFSLYVSNPEFVGAQISAHSHFLAFLMAGMIATPILREILTLKLTAKDLVEQWKKKRDEKKFSKRWVQTLKWMEKDPLIQESLRKHTYLRSDYSEEAVFQQLPHLQEAFIEEIQFLIQQGEWGNKEAQAKLALYDSFMKKIFFKLTPFEKEYLEKVFRKQGMDSPFPEHLQVRLAGEMAQFYEDLKGSGFWEQEQDTLNLGQHLGFLKRENLDMISASNRSYHMNVVGLTIAATLMSLNVSVGYIPTQIDILPVQSFADWIRYHHNFIEFSAIAAVIGPTLYQVWDVFRYRGSRSVSYKRNVERIHHLTAALNIFKRPWLFKKSKCAHLLFAD